MNLIAVLLFISTLQICASNQIEIPITYSVMHLQNTSSEMSANHELISDKLGLNHHAGMRDQLNHDFDLASDYVFLKMPDGKIEITFKDYLPGYKACFDMGMLHTTSAVSWAKRKFFSDYNNSNYFASKFDRYSPTRVFHCVGNYRYKGFCDYVKKLPGFEDFILSIGEQLKPGSALHKALAKSDNLQDFAVLKKIHQEKMRELEQKAQTKHQEELRKILSARNFSEHGIKLLEHHGIANQFLYDGNMQQRTQLERITGFMNDVGEFRNEYHKTAELSEISDSAAGFGYLANNANRENLPSTSQAFLEIGQNILALGRGLINGCERNVSGIYHMVRHPINTFIDIGTLATNIGIGIGNVASLVPRFGMGLILDDQAMIQSVQQDVNHYCDGAKQIYQYIDKTWQDKTTTERYELAGSLMVDLLLMKGLPAASSKLSTIKNLSRYKPQAFSKLGNIGREINETVGLICAKSRDYLRRGGQAIMAGEAELLASEGFGFAREIEAGLNAVKQDISVNSSVNNLAKVTQFEIGATELAATYGLETVEEARMALRINEYKLAKNCENKLLQELENTCANIQKIRTKPHRHNFIYDVDHGFKATECSVMEGLTACAVEDQGFVKQLARSSKEGVDFVDELGRSWDIKSPISKTPIHPYGSFRAEKIASDIISEMKKGENIIIDITNVIESDCNLMLTELRSKLSGNKIKDILIIHRDLAAKSGFFY